MKEGNFKQMATLTMLVALFTVPAIATNGYLSSGIGVRYNAMAGAGVGLHLSPMAAATNPAAMAFVGSGYDINLSLFNPNRQYTVTGNPSLQPGTFGLAPGTVESGKNIFLIPALGANWMIGEKSSAGINIYGNGGMNTTYDFPVFGFQTTGVNLAQLFVAPTWSVMLTEKHSFGISPIFAYQSFEANGLLAFGDFSSDATNLSNNGSSNSTGFGARLGYLGKFTDFLSVGVSVQTRIKMSEFEEYAGLFAEGGGFDIPMNWTAGVALQFDKLGIALDVQQIYYSKVKSIGNPMLPNLQQAPLGMENGAGFGWQDMTVFKIGLSYMAAEDLTLRAGFSFGNQPIPESEVLFNILAPGVIEQHLTAGVSKKIGEDKEVSFFLMRALSNSVKGDNPLEFPGRQTIELTMDQWQVGAGFTF